MDFVVSSFRAFVIELLFAAGDGHGFRPSMSDVGTGILGTSDTISAGWDTDFILDRYRELERRVSAGQADTAGKTAAENLGTFPSTGAVHDGTSTPALDVSQGLVSALGARTCTRSSSRAPRSCRRCRARR